MTDKNKLKVKLILFDVGNTILNINYIYISNVLNSFGYNISARKVKNAEIKARYFMDEYYCNKKASTESLSSFELYTNKVMENLDITDKRQRKKIISFLKQKHLQSNIYDYVEKGTKKLLKYFYLNNFQMGVVSNSRGDVKYLLERCGLKKYFDLIIDSEEVGVEKPDKKIFELALDYYKVSPEETVYIGDMYYIDIIGAQKAGINTILIDRDDIYKDKDCIRIRKLTDLKNLVVS